MLAVFVTGLITKVDHGRPLTLGGRRPSDLGPGYGHPFTPPTSRGKESSGRGSMTMPDVNIRPSRSTCWTRTWPSFGSGLDAQVLVLHPARDAQEGAR